MKSNIRYPALLPGRHGGSTRRGFYELDYASLESISFIERPKLPALDDGEVGNLQSSDGSDAVPSTPQIHSDAQSISEHASIALHSSGQSWQPVKPRELSLANSLDQLQESNAWQVESMTKVSLIEYRDWRSPLAESSLQHKPLIKETLGDAWMIPEDGRLPLLFSREYLETLSDAQLDKYLPVLAAFRGKVKTNAFVDFKIVDDYKPSSGRKGGPVTYRL